MTDPVNSSDEVMQMAWQAVIDAARKGQIYELAIDDELDGFAAAVRAEAVADERRRIVRDIIALAPVNCELRPDGKEDPIFAAWVEGVGDSARVARGRSE